VIALKLVPETDCNCEYCAGPNLAAAADAAQTIADLQRQVAEFNIERTKLNYMIIDSRKEDAGWLQKFREATKSVQYWRDKHDRLLEQFGGLQRHYGKLLEQHRKLRIRRAKKSIAPITPKKPAKPKRKV